MEGTVQRKVGHRCQDFRIRRRNLDCPNGVKPDCSFYQAEHTTSLSRSTSTYSYASPDVSSFVTMATPLANSDESSQHLRLPGCDDSSSDARSGSDSPSRYYPSSGHKSDQHLHLRLPSSASDDDMSANSPDSGFESTTPSGSTGAGDFEDLLKSSSLFFDSGSLENNRLCLIPPPKPKPPSIEKEPQLRCRWKNCGCSYQNTRDLHTHLISEHIDVIKDSFCCDWSGCKVHGKPSRSIAWLRQHVTTHTGGKRFKCIVGGCEASFGSQGGYRRHVSSHFSEVHLPKAKPNGQSERKYLVKKRKIKDKTKALANAYDCMDQRAISLVRGALVKYTCAVGLFPKACNLKQEEKGISGQLCKNETRSEFTAHNHIPNGETDDPSRLLFFGIPQKRSRKCKGHR